MNKKYIECLVSPKTHLPLTQCGDTLTTSDNSEVYKVVKSVPVMLPETTTADWHRELIEAILWEYPNEIEKMYADIDWSKQPNETYIKYIKQLLHDKQGIASALEKYAVSDTVHWIVKSQDNSAISKECIKDFKRYATKQTGKKRVDLTKPGGEYFEAYRALVLETLKSSPKIMVELATGAGGGTSAVALNMSFDATLFTVDIGFNCMGNAIGIGKYLHKQADILSVCANFWYMPFADKSIDTVFTQCGLDESRENERTISEVARILKKGGKFVCTARKSSFMREATILEPFGFTEAESVKLMKKCRLYSDIETLKKCCAEHGLIEIHLSENTRKDSTVFVTVTFEKLK